MSESKLDKIENKIDKLEDRLLSIDVTLAAQHESLKLHMKRTDLLELNMEPLKKDAIAIRTLGKFLVYLSVAATVVECYFRIMGGK